MSQTNSLSTHVSGQGKVLSKVFIPGFKLRVSPCGLPSLLGYVQRCIRTQQKVLIDNINMDILWHTRRDPRYREILNQLAQVILVDGMPVKWLARFAGVQVPTRMALTDVVPALLHLATLNNYRVFVLGSNQQTLDKAYCELAAQSSLPAQIGNWSHPRHRLEDPEINGAVLQEMQEFAPQLLLVALGSPWQSHWIRRNWDALPPCVIVPVGGAFDYIAKTVGRAPGWMQAMGLEWVYRLLFDRQKRDRSLVQRYLINDLPFAIQLSLEILLTRARHQQPLVERAG